MPAYLIVYGANPADRLAAYAFDTRKEAWAASVTDLVPRVPPGGRAGGCAYVIERLEDVTFSDGLLAAVFSGLTGTFIARFDTRSLGLRSLLEVLPLVTSSTKPEDSTMSDANVHTETDAQTAANGAGHRGRKPKYDLDQVIEVFDVEHKLKPGNKNRQYLDVLKSLSAPVTIRAALAAGVPSSYLWGFFEPKGLIAVRSSHSAG